MTEKLAVVWETIQPLKFTESDETIGPDLLNRRNLYETRYLVKSGSAQSLMKRFLKSSQAGDIIYLEFYDPHGGKMRAPLIKFEYQPFDTKVQEMLGGFPADVIKATVTLTQEQLWALETGNDEFSFGY